MANLPLIFSGNRIDVTVVEQGIGEPAGANPVFEILGHGQAGQRGVECGGNAGIPADTAG